MPRKVGSKAALNHVGMQHHHLIHNMFLALTGGLTSVMNIIVNAGTAHVVLQRQGIQSLAACGQNVVAARCHTACSTICTSAVK